MTYERATRPDETLSADEAAITAALKVTTTAGVYEFDAGFTRVRFDETRPWFRCDTVSAITVGETFTIAVDGNTNHTSEAVVTVEAL